MDQKQKWVFIINPVAGNGFGLSQADKIKEMIDKYDLDADVVYTERRGHASELSKEYAQNGYKYIIAVGGDGTFNEVAAPLVFNKDVITGQISGGTANGTNEIAGFPDRFHEKDWESFFKANVISMDVGLCNEKIFFFTGVQFGLAVQVAQKFNESREAGKKQNYLWLVLKTILFFKEKRMIVISEGKRTETDCFINTVSNGARTYAKSFLLTPTAIANDGLLDICSIMKLSLPQRIRILLSVPKGTHLKDKKVQYYQTPKLSLEFPVNVPFHADGEIFYAQHFELSVIHDGLNLIYNPEGDHHFFNIRQES